MAENCKIKKKRIQYIIGIGLLILIFIPIMEDSIYYVALTYPYKILAVLNIIMIVISVCVIKLFYDIYQNHDDLFDAEIKAESEFLAKYIAECNSNNGILRYAILESHKQFRNMLGAILMFIASISILASFIGNVFMGFNKLMIVICIVSIGVILFVTRREMQQLIIIEKYEDSLKKKNKEV